MHSAPNDILSSTELTSNISAVRSSAFSAYAGLALLLYDYAITLDQERTEIWHRKASLASWLFAGVRIGFMASFSCEALWNSSMFMSILSCDTLFYTNAVCGYFAEISLMGTFVLRTFAIYNRSWTVVVCLGGMTLTKLVIDVIGTVGRIDTSEGVRQFSGCVFTPTTKIGQNSTTINCILIIIFDTSVFGLTTYRTARAALSARRLGLNSGYSRFVLRDGLLYYAAIELMTVTMTPLTQIPSEHVTRTILANMQAAVAAALTQRLVLNLRGAVSQSDDSSLAHIATMDAPAFSIGPIAVDDAGPLCRDAYVPSSTLGIETTSTTSTATVDASGTALELADAGRRA